MSKIDLNTLQSKIFESAFHHSEDGILLLKDGRFIQFNPAAVKMLGAKDSRQLFNLQPAELSPPQQPDGRLSTEKAGAMIKTAFDKGFHRFEWVHQRLNGETFPCEVTITPVTIDNSVFLHTTWRDLSRYKQQELQLSQLIQQTNIGQITIDEKGCVRGVNQAFVQLLGVETEVKIKGHSIFDWIPTELWQQNQHEMTECLNRGITQDFETEFLGSHHQRISVLINAHVQTLNNQRYIVAICNNISSQKQAERQLQVEIKRRTALQKLLEAAINYTDKKAFLTQALAILMTTKLPDSQEKGAILLLEGNPPVLKVQVSQNMPEDIVKQCTSVTLGGCFCGKTVKQNKLFHTDYINADCQLLENHNLTAYGGYTIPIHIGQQVFGVIILYQVANKPASESDMSYLQAAADIVARTLQWIESEQALKQKKKLLDSIIYTALDGIVTIDETGIIESFNPAACQLFGYTEEEVLKQNIKLIIPAPHHDRHNDYLHRYQRTQQSTIIGQPTEFNALKKNGLEFPIRLSVSEIKLTDKVLFCGFIHDLSVQKNLEIDLRQHAELLQLEVDAQTEELLIAQEISNQANQAKTNFFANMSHELRTPLHGILSFARFGIKNVEQGDLKKLAKYFDRINSSGERLLVLLNDLLDLAKLEAGKMKLTIETNDLIPVINNCIAEFDGSLTEKQLSIQFQPLETTLLAKFDQVRISQVIANLLSNAIKFSPGQRTIFIHLSTHTPEQDTPHIQCSISDQGQGIPKQELESIFNQYIQSSNTSQQSVAGTGLGLAICKEIIEAHHGKIWADNHPDGGAVFSFTLPLTKA